MTKISSRCLPRVLTPDKRCPRLRLYEADLARFLERFLVLDGVSLSLECFLICSKEGQGCLIWREGDVLNFLGYKSSLTIFKQTALSMKCTITCWSHYEKLSRPKPRKTDEMGFVSPWQRPCTHIPGFNVRDCGFKLVDHRPCPPDLNNIFFSTLLQKHISIALNLFFIFRVIIQHPVVETDCYYIAIHHSLFLTKFSYLLTL